MKTLTTLAALMILATPATDALARGGSSSGSHSSGVRAVHNYVRPTSAQARIHTPKLAPTAMHKAKTTTPYIAPHFTTFPASTTAAPAASMPSLAPGALGTLESVSHSSTVSSTGATSQTLTLKGSNETVKLTRSVSKTGVVTYRETVTPATTTTTTPKSSTSTSKSGSGGSSSKAPAADKAPAAPADKPVKAASGPLTGLGAIVSSSGRCRDDEVRNMFGDCVRR